MNLRNLTAEELRNMAQESSRRSAESWERSDNDGFRSQAASDTMAAVYRLQADIVDNGGTIEVCALFLLDGRIASTHQADGQYGTYWVLNDEAAAVLDKRFITDSNASKATTRQKNNAKKGIALGMIKVAGYAKVAGNGIGAYAQVDVEALKNGDYEIITTDAIRDGIGFIGRDWS